MLSKPVSNPTADMLRATKFVQDTCLIPLSSKDQPHRVAAYARIYSAWQPLVSRFQWRVETDDEGKLIAVSTINLEDVEMSALLRHPHLADRAPGVQ